MTDYTKNTDFAAKDGFASGNAAKRVLGTELDDEFNEIATSSASKEDAVNKGAANGYAPLTAGSVVPDVNLPTASETVRGPLEIATQAETDTGTDDTRAVTPLKLATKPVLQATEAVVGGGELATQAETNTGTDDLRIVTPLKLANATSLLQATDTQKGALEIATGAEVITGTDNVRAITPLALQSLTSLATRRGIIELATQAEVDAGADTDRAITPATLAGTGLVGGRNGAKATNGVALPINDNTETTVLFSTEAYDTNSFHSTSSNTGRLTIPTGVTQVRLTAYMSWEPNGSSFRLLKIRKNGSDGAIDDDQITYQPEIFVSAANASVPDLGMYIDSGIITVAATDFFELRVFQNSGLQLDLLDEQCWFQIEVIS